ncbi:MAG: hypothetical protein Q7J80_00250 [Anaerolineales bacterium]|nr:hypothetical protein [Anaerolineales bacterium]
MGKLPSVFLLNEKPFLLLVVGYPVQDAVMPDIHKKPLEEILTRF